MPVSSPPIADSLLAKGSRAVRFQVAAGVLTVPLAWHPSLAAAQSVAERRQAILQAEDRGASGPKDIATITAGLRSDPETTRIAVRALGRLERPALLSQILPALRSANPDVRAEAANAVAQAAQGFKLPKPSAPMTLSGVQAALIGRLEAEGEGSVRGALCEAIARLPYATAADVDRGERAIIGAAARNHTLTDRLGAAKALEALVRVQFAVRPPSEAAIDLLKSLVHEPTEPGLEPVRDARVRRLALEGLISAKAVDDTVIGQASKDIDAQVRRLAVRAAAAGGRGGLLVDQALHDPATMVRVEALRVAQSLGSDAACTAAMSAATDWATEVAVVALDQLAVCRTDAAIALLERTVNDPSSTTGPRTWPRAAHAIVALASAAPEQAIAALSALAGSEQWQLRYAAARAASELKERIARGALAADANTLVSVEAAAALGGAPRADPGDDTSAQPPPQASSSHPSVLRARVTIRELGRFDLVLLAMEAPATVARFAEQAASGSFNGRTFRMQPNTLLLGARDHLLPGAFPGAPLTTRPETGTWPHVRGAVGVSAAGRDEGNALFFIDLVDNPPFDHEHTVFGQVVNGVEVIDQIVEGDVIESVDILP
jgi:peptidyl-prolyl cis-trans isomerase B (cyclophilin B)